MEINADFSRTALVHSEEEPWVPSPMPGVERRMLDRIGEEVARATSIVRYAPDSHFSPHTHGGGEEFVVLDGVFEDESGAFPAGTYVRNPPGSRHTPGSTPGCILFVKLWQFAPDDSLHVCKDMRQELVRIDAERASALLHEDGRERVTYTEAAPGAAIEVSDSGGIELLVLEGTVSDDARALRKGSWLRLPDESALRGVCGPEGARIWMKTGHLRDVAAPSA
jgi:anti-sigma factor ChrR (cupin superfamily)